jgi:methylthioribulose-1-phosphate dehydratase
MATLLWKEREFRVSGLEMIKGVRWGGVGAAMSYLDELVVPIIENTPEEEDLRHTMAEVSIPEPGCISLTTYDTRQTMKVHPKAAAILVRRHGVYVWGA